MTPLDLFFHDGAIVEVEFKPGDTLLCALIQVADRGLLVYVAEQDRHRRAFLPWDSIRLVRETGALTLTLARRDAGLLLEPEDVHRRHLEEIVKNARRD